MKEFLKKILAPVDGSGPSREAEQVTAQIARKTGAAVTVMHVIPYSLLYAKLRSGYEIPRDIRNQIIGAIEENAQKIIDEALAFFTEEGITVDANRENYTDVAYSILKTSKRGYDLIVMGGRGENEKDPYAIGSVTKKVVGHSEVPTLIIKKASSFSNMLVCLDDSQYSINALKFAVQLGERMNSKITLINVQEPRIRELSPETAEELGRQILSHALGGIIRSELKVEKRVAFGIPPEKIVETAEKDGQDLVVMSSVGLGAIREFLLGSVCEDVVEKAKCSVLVVPPGR
jgi:nucleotide-binding universal stress UspA family protein